MDLTGPTDWSNWVIPQSLMMGAYPKDMALVTTLLSEGINTFVNLIHGKELERLEKTPYFEKVKKMATQMDPPINVNTLRYFHLPIYDKDIAKDEEVINIVQTIENELKSGRRVYVHCRGGHGRTGTIVAVFLGKFFGLDGYSALDLVSKCHDFRKDVKAKPGVYSCPETHDQKSQVYRILDKPSK
eukprot:TRINITY_DN1962_c0_g1_i1.p1 TRINITY_DN1962_c0_g1~~TRINITY_DN1962_c0_g1_i1.p1  ORF type:complete len:186 (+),score=33.91 TRINITY_DN1962_c0_g1_i1:169-726(+)